MEFTFKNAHIYNSGVFETKDYTAKLNDTDPSAGSLSAFNNICVLPAFCDVHVHFREPGFFYKETIRTGSLSAARGGYTDVCTMPNLNPVPDSAENMQKQLEIINKSAVIRVHPYAAVTVGEKGEDLSDMEALAPLCIAFSDDGKGIQNEEIMLEAMKKAKKLGKIIAAHCEDNSRLFGGYIHAGEYARLHGHRGICSESEWKPIERDLRLAKKTGCKYHVCHISCKESVELIRRAKAEGVDVTCETAPHYLVFNDMDLREDGRFKMNPPIRSEEDRSALMAGIKDGTIDMIATDHAPHTAEEKSGGLEKSLMGVVGLETAFPVLYTELVKTGIITLEKLIELMAVNPRQRFGITETEDICVYNLESEYKINSQEFASMGKSTPFEGKTVFGKNLLTVCGGKAVWQI